MQYVGVALLLVSCWYCARALPVGRDRRAAMSETEAAKYLDQFGYNPGKDAQALAFSSGAPSKQSILLYQRFMGLSQTGILDEQTLQQMQKPRCGRSDTASGTRRSFAVVGGKWPKTSLTYRITAFSSDLSEQEQRRTIGQAFKLWEEVTPLRFTEVASGSHDITILFAPGEHGDGEPFDGPGGVLAHAALPDYGGDAHFDEGETWTVRTSSGINLLQVAAHEFGHSLGLDHSSVQGALMFPTYDGYIPNFQLHQDDINGIQSLYGASDPGTTQGTGMTPATTEAAEETDVTTEDGSNDDKTTTLHESETTEWHEGETTEWHDGEATEWHEGEGETTEWHEGETTEWHEGETTEWHEGETTEWH